MSLPFAWILKTEPETFSWADLCKEGTTIWEGVRNYQARNYLAMMTPGQPALIYHSGKERRIVGLASVNSAPFTDPSDATGKFLAVEIVPTFALARPVALSELRLRPELAGLQLFTQSRLSVVPLTECQFQDILSLNTQAHAQGQG